MKPCTISLPSSMFFQKPPYDGPVEDGCTACVVLIRDNQIIVGNAGDSRCVLSRNDQVWWLILLSSICDISDTKSAYHFVITHVF